MKNLNKNELKEQVVDYASKVFFFCVKRCNSRMDAEDLSQTILLEVLEAIDKGAQIDNMDFYIWGVCKNQYNMYLRKTIKNRNNLEYNEEEIDMHSDNSKTPLEELLEDEKIRKMNSAIKLLSKDYAEILYAYYIEDKTLKFIAEKMNLPLGTVGRRLSDIRKKLKEYIDMERLNGKKAYVPKNFQVVQSFAGNLNFNPSNVADPLLIKNLLYHSYGIECSIEDYSIELGIARPYIEDYVKELVKKDFLIKLENGKYLSNIAFINKKERREILDFARENISGYYNALAKFTKDNLEFYKSLLDKTNAIDEHLMWSFLCLTMVIVENEFSTSFTLRNDGTNWDVVLLETLDKLYNDEFFVSFNGCNGDYNSRRLCAYAFPSDSWKEDGGVSDVIAYKNALTGSFDLHILHEVLIKNTKYSKMNEEDKMSVNKYVEIGAFSILDDFIKVNIPVMTIENYKELKNKIVKEEALINAYKELYNGIYMKVRTLIPSYLEKQTPFIIQATILDRSLILHRVFEDGIIKDDKTRKVFIYNGIIIK